MTHLAHCVHAKTSSSRSSSLSSHSRPPSSDLTHLREAENDKPFPIHARDAESPFIPALNAIHPELAHDHHFADDTTTKPLPPTSTIAIIFLDTRCSLTPREAAERHLPP